VVGVEDALVEAAMGPPTMDSIVCPLNMVR